MIKNTSLKIQFIVSILLVMLITLSITFYISYENLKDKIDNSQELLYKEKIANIKQLIDEKYEKLQKTGMVEAYEDSFKQGVLGVIKKVFYKQDIQAVHPFIINDKNLFLMHKKFNEKNLLKYKNDEVYKKLISTRNGNFDINYNNEELWVIYENFKAWDWIIGYKVEKQIKYKELYAFRDNFLISSLAILIITSLIILFILKYILIPISILNNISKKISQGNLHIDIEVKGAKELRELSSNFRKMRDKIVDDMKSKEESYALLKENERFLRLLIDNMPNQIFWKDKDLRYIGCNKLFAQLVGFDDPKDLIGLNDFELIRDSKFAKEYRRDDLSIIEKKESIITKEEEFNTVNGNNGWVLTSKIPINVNDDVQGVLGFCLDITKIKEQEIKIKGFNKQLQIEVEQRTRELQESNDELETSLENLRKTQNKLVESEKLASLGSLVAGVAHEINTPVGIGVTGTSHLKYLNDEISSKYINDEMSEEDFNEYLKSSSDLVKIINSNLNRTADIVKNFKQVAVDQTSEQKRIFKVKEYIRGVLISIESLLKNKNIKIEVQGDESLEVVSYPGFFAQIITNLISNSAIHGFKDLNEGNIFISIKKENSFLSFEYKDNGVGISKDNLNRIYDPFFSTNKENGGSGLGLNIVYNIVTMNLGGSIDCSSKLNEGTQFKVKIPIEE